MWKEKGHLNQHAVKYAGTLPKKEGCVKYMRTERRPPTEGCLLYTSSVYDIGKCAADIREHLYLYQFNIFPDAYMAGEIHAVQYGFTGGSLVSAFSLG